MAKHYVMVVQVAKCIGCQACTAACKFSNNVPEGKFRTQSPAVGLLGKYPEVSVYFEKEACQMCQDAPCVAVCPTKASHYNQDGVVLVDDAKCVGCKYCLVACPYEARFINPRTGTADKCTFCYEMKVAKGDLPACVATCVGGALAFGDANDPGSDVAKLLANNVVEVRKPGLGTKPSVYYIYKGVKK